MISSTSGAACCWLEGADPEVDDEEDVDDEEEDVDDEEVDVEGEEVDVPPDVCDACAVPEEAVDVVDVPDPEDAWGKLWSRMYTSLSTSLPFDARLTILK